MRVHLVAALLSCLVLGTSRAADNGKHVSDEKRLYNDLLANYNKYVRPSNASHDKVTVKFGVSLMDIIAVNEAEGTLVTQLWFNQLWNDAGLKWDPAEYYGVTAIRIPASKLWTPDIVLFNPAEATSFLQDVLAVVYHTGDVLWIPPAIVKSRCAMDMTYFPHDTQNCLLKFGSWSYDGYQVDPQFYEDRKEVVTDDYIPDMEWDLVDTSARRYEMYYPCCSEPYPNLSFNISIARKNSLYSVIMVTPYVFLALLSPIVFLFPFSETQRFSLGGSILICLVFMLCTFGNAVPLTMGRLPLIAQYYTSIFILLSLSMIFSAVILNMADRKSPPPRILKLILVDGLAFILCVPRDTDEKPIQSDAEDNTGDWKVMARALDRLCFLVYVVVTVCLTLACLSQGS